MSRAVILINVVRSIKNGCISFSCVFLLVFLSSCSPEKSTDKKPLADEVKSNVQEQKAKSSQVNPTEKYKAGSVWRVEYGDTILNVPMDYIGQRDSRKRDSHHGFFEVFVSYPDMAPGKNGWPGSEDAIRLSIRLFNDNYHEITAEDITDRVDKGHLLEIGPSEIDPGLMEYSTTSSLSSLNSSRQYLAQDPSFLRAKKGTQLFLV